MAEAIPPMIVATGRAPEGDPTVKARVVEWINGPLVPVIFTL